jgi:hypothetical protein
LSRPGDCRGGNEFFRHRATERGGTDESAWELLMSVPMRFNRLLLLPP